MSGSNELALLDEIVLGSAQGRSATPLLVEVVRGLLPDDLPALTERTRAQPTGLLQLRHIHHQLAQLIAKGTDNAEIALITGYNSAYISKIKSDPLFEELLSHYSKERELIFIDTMERMKALGLSTLEEIQQRMADEPEKWTNQQVMDLAELLLIKPQSQQGRGQHHSGGPSVQVNIRFEPVKEVQGPILEMTATARED